MCRRRVLRLYYQSPSLHDYCRELTHLMTTPLNCPLPAGLLVTTPWPLPLTWPHSLGLFCALPCFFTAKVTSVKLYKAATYVLMKSLDLGQFDITSVTYWHCHNIVTRPHQLVSCGLFWLVVVTSCVNISYLSLTSSYVPGKSHPPSFPWPGPVVSSCRSLAEGRCHSWTRPITQNRSKSCPISLLFGSPFHSNWWVLYW